MFQQSPSGLEIVQSGAERRLSFFNGASSTAGPLISQSTVQLQAQVDGNSAHYSYSLDGGHSFHELGTAAQLRFSWWKASRPALFAFTTRDGNPGAVDFDWVHYRPEGANPW